MGKLIQTPLKFPAGKRQCCKLNSPITLFNLYFATCVLRHILVNTFLYWKQNVIPILGIKNNEIKLYLLSFLLNNNCRPVTRWEVTF